MTQSTWLKGNLHTHSTNSDGDSAPEHVAEWYRAHGYDWLCLSDHNHLTILEGSETERRKWPLLIPGEEITSMAGERPVHLGGYGVERLVEPSMAEDVVESLRENVERITAAGGLAGINHPNYRWAFDDRELLQVEGFRFIEVFNGHPRTHNEGGGGKSSVAGIWDRLLSAGRRVWGIAVDDAHHFQGEFGPDRSNPGRGWVSVKAGDLSAAAILDAMDRGEFYSSTGVTINDMVANRSEIQLDIDPETDHNGAQTRYTTVFTGSSGLVLHESTALSPRYRPSSLDGYVRATVHSSRGTRAWTQPVFVEQ